MRSSKLAISVTAFLVIWLVGLGVTTVQGGSKNVKWERIEGVIVPGTAFAGPFNVVGGVNSVAFSWTAARGQARVNLRTGLVMFDVNGLVLAAHIAGFAAIGTKSTAVTTVKGTVVCDSLGTPSLFDTNPPVPLSAQGNADFQGTTLPALPRVCNDAAFLIRPATGVIENRWIAHGAVRTP